MDIFISYLEDMIAVGANPDFGDIGSLISIAILEAGSDREAAITALNQAKASLLECPAIAEFLPAIDSAIFHLGEWEQF